MKTTKILSILLLITILFSTAGCASKPAVWETDYDKAIETATKQKKDLLIFFSGMDWDGVSPVIMSDIFDEKFMKTAGKNYVLLNIDIVTDENLLTEEERQARIEKAYKFGVQSCPAFIVTTPDSYMYGLLSYVPDTTTSEDMINQLSEASETGKIVKDLVKKLDTVNGPERVTVINDLVNAVPAELTSQFYDLVATVPDLDPNNESGLIGPFMILLAQQQSLLAMYQGDAAGAIGAFADLAQNPILTPEDVQTAYYFAMYVAVQFNMGDELLKYGNLAIEAAPETETAATLTEYLEYVKEQLAKLPAEEESAQ